MHSVCGGGNRGLQLLTIDKPPRICYTVGMKRLPAVFVQYGTYISNRKREGTRFSVVYSVSPEELEKEMKKCLLNLNKLSLSNQSKDL